MLLTKPSELAVKTTYAGLIYGQPGVGKTTLALSSANPVCIDADRGMHRIEKRFQAPSLQMENYGQLLELLNSNEIKEFETIVIDTLGKLVDHITDYVIQENPKHRQGDGQLTQKGWGQVKSAFKALVRLINGKNKSVIFVAHESEEKEGDVTKKRPDVSGSARKDVVKELDFMGYMEMRGNRRTISFNPSEAYYAKNSLGLNSVIEVPDITQGNSFIKDVIAGGLKRKREADAAMSKPYEDLIRKIDGLANGASDIESLNKAYGEIAGLETIWDSKVYAWNAVKAKADKIGAVFDRKENRFSAKAAA